MSDNENYNNASLDFWPLVGCSDSLYAFVFVNFRIVNLCCLFCWCISCVIGIVGIDGETMHVLDQCKRCVRFGAPTFFPDLDLG